jgi:ectoine hydroxylase-related dioxygenase (phytanoyl-CoA dioxygenase family)
MKADSPSAQRASRVWLTPEACDLEEFIALVDRRADPADYPLAATLQSNVPIYDGEAIRAAAEHEESRRALMAEWAWAMREGAGIVVFRGAFADLAAVDAATEVFFAIIEQQRRENKASGDHFAKPGANDRIWNALEKLALRAPKRFARYYANEAIAMVSQAWLGTGYQITSQVNVVNPGGAAQSAHRDYHMGFQSAEEIAEFPAHAHLLSPFLTLQGAVAHCDMPLESGPTLYLPFSQTFAPGYFAYRKPEFAAYFDAHHVQLPLAKGDAAFFNPALFHAAGHNKTSDIRRIGNLLQVSSAYGRSMESVDRGAMAKALYPALRAASDLSAQGIANVIAASAEGYAFPTNLDRDPPIGGLAPQTQAALMGRALAEGWEAPKFAAAVDEHAARRLT